MGGWDIRECKMKGIAEYLTTTTTVIIIFTNYLQKEKITCLLKFQVLISLSVSTEDEWWGLVGTSCWSKELNVYVPVTRRTGSSVAPFEISGLRDNTTRNHSFSTHHWPLPWTRYCDKAVETLSRHNCNSKTNYRGVSSTWRERYSDLREVARGSYQEGWWMPKLSFKGKGSTVKIFLFEDSGPRWKRLASADR